MKLSTGDESTLGNYRRLCVAAFGEASAPVKFLDDKIAETPAGEAAPVLVDEAQMLQLFAQLVAQARRACPHDPRALAGKPIGMYHCPDCGDMVIAGLPHDP